VHLATDQRGYFPPKGVWDIGAYQYNATPPSAPAVALGAAGEATAAPGQSGDSFNITESIAAAIEASPSNGAVVQAAEPAGGSPKIAIGGNSFAARKLATFAALTAKIGITRSVAPFYRQTGLFR